ncbi:MAG: dihydroneopterin aldolase [Granulosicoccus sp.]
MDRIFINNLTVETIIGIYDRERITPQRVILDLEMSADIARAAATEDIASTLNYKTLSETLTHYLQQSSFQLIETMAERVSEIIRDDFGVQWVKLTLHKPDALPGDIDVGVIIERGSRG